MMATLATAPLALTGPGSAFAEPLVASDDFTRLQGVSGVSLLYPASSWVVAINRAGKPDSKPGELETLLSLGNFKVVDVVGVFRITPSNELLSLSPDQLVGALIQQGNMRTAIISSTVGDGTANKNGEVFSCEHTTETCRGMVEEGNGGQITCTARDMSILPTILRRHRTRCISKDGYIYIIAASGAPERWPQAGPVFEKVITSFSLDETQV
eukprot:jgi/Mesvir1/864/Mv17435-RA.1